MKFKIDKKKLEKAKEDRERNKIERLEFVGFWANYVKTHEDKDWSKQQKIIIDSQID